MKSKTIKIKEILKLIKEESIIYKFDGNEDDCIEGFSSFYSYKNNTITWLNSVPLLTENKHKKIRLLVTNVENYSLELAYNIILTEEPKRLFFTLVERIFIEEEDYKISPYAHIDDTVVLPNHISIGIGCIVERDVKIGEGTRIYNNVVIKQGTSIGKNCIIKSGTVIGEEGFGYYIVNDAYRKVPHLGNVIIKNNVEIGSNTSIDRGTIDDTIIGEGTKIDNLCHIAHNAVIGKNVWIIAGSVVGGSVIINDNSKLFINSSIRDGVKIPEGCIIGMGATVIKNIDIKDAIFVGNPAKRILNQGGE